MRTVEARLMDLPKRARAQLVLAGLDPKTMENWLRRNGSDGCTIAPDLYLRVCLIHDYICRTKVLPRWQADDLARDLILILAWESEDELPWRLLGMAYAWVFWTGCVFGDWLGVG